MLHRLPHGPVLPLVTGILCLILLLSTSLTGWLGVATGWLLAQCMQRYQITVQRRPTHANPEAV